MFKRRRHSVPTLNTTSTADISFMLLIFFLVTTSMDADKGLLRELPSPNKKEATEFLKVEEGTLVEFKITQDNKLIMDGKDVNPDEISKPLQDFLLRNRARHIISIDANPNSSYDVYFRLQNEIAVSYKAARNKLALERYKRRYDKCSKEQQEAIREMLPQRVTESYTTSLEGGNI